MLALFSTEVSDTDFWWHLATGRYVAENHALPAPDPFAWTTEQGGEAYPGEAVVRYFNLTHEWLAQSVWYALYAVGGFSALVLLKAVLLALFCGAAGWVAGRRRGDAILGGLVALAAAPIATFFAADRPALVSFFLVAAFVVLLERFRESGDRRLLFALPLLAVLWANSHGGFFLGWLVIGAYAVEGFRGPSERGKALWIALGATVVASGLNPNGFRIFEVLPAYRASFLQQTLIEWKPLPVWGPPYFIQALVYVTAGVMAAAWRRVRLADALLFAAFSVSAFLAFRNAMFVSFFAPLYLGVYLRAPLRVDRRVAAVGLAVLAVALLGWRVASGRAFELRAAEWKFPVEAARVLKELDFSGNLFNTYEYGGYLIWALAPERRVYIDGRALSEAVYLDYREILYAEDLSLLDRYGVDLVVANGFEFVQGTLYPLVQALGDPRNEVWTLVHQDAQAVVFVRTSALDEATLGARRLDKRAVLDHIADSCSTYIDHDPELAACARTAGFVLLSAGDSERGRTLLERYRSLWGSDPDVERALAN